MKRRGFLTLAAGLIAAPAIARASSLERLPVRAPLPDADIVEWYWRNGLVLPSRTYNMHRTVVLGESIGNPQILHSSFIAGHPDSIVVFPEKSPVRAHVEAITSTRVEFLHVCWRDDIAAVSQGACGYVFQ